MMTGRVIAGNAVAGVMVRTPAGGLVTANWIKFVPPVPLADVMAARSEPAPVSLVVVTMNGSAAQGRTAAASKPDKHKEIFVIILEVNVSYTAQESVWESFRISGLLRAEASMPPRFVGRVPSRGDVLILVRESKLLGNCFLARPHVLSATRVRENWF